MATLLFSLSSSMFNIVAYALQININELIPIKGLLAVLRL